MELGMHSSAWTKMLPVPSETQDSSASSIPSEHLNLTAGAVFRLFPSSHADTGLAHAFGGPRPFLGRCR